MEILKLNSYKVIIGLVWQQGVFSYDFANVFNLFFEVHEHIHHYKMWVQFISPRSLNQWIHCFFIGPCSLQPMNSLKIQWNQLAYRDTFCCSDCSRSCSTFNIMFSFCISTHNVGIIVWRHTSHHDQWNDLLSNFPHFGYSI